jgi:hypothetical protein
LHREAFCTYIRLRLRLCSRRLNGWHQVAEFILLSALSINSIHTDKYPILS